MSLADGLASGNPLGQFRLPVLLPELLSVRTLSGTDTLTAQHRPIQRLDPGGSARNVDLPAEATSKDMWFLIVNAADAAENLTIRDDGANTIATANQNEGALVWCDGTTWRLAILFTAPAS